MELSMMMAKHNNYRSWYMKVNAIISKYGLYTSLKTQMKPRSRQFLSEFGQHCFVQDWHASLGNDLHRRHGGRNKLKHSFEWEPYLTYVKSPPLRTTLCRFHISCHLLEIERGRYHDRNPNLQISVTVHVQVVYNWVENWWKIRCIA